MIFQQIIKLPHPLNYKKAQQPKIDAGRPEKLILFCMVLVLLVLLIQKTLESRRFSGATMAEDRTVAYSAGHSLYPSSISPILGLQVCVLFLVDIVPSNDVVSHMQ